MVGLDERRDAVEGRAIEEAMKGPIIDPVKFVKVWNTSQHPRDVARFFNISEGAASLRHISTVRRGFR